MMAWGARVAALAVLASAACGGASRDKWPAGRPRIDKLDFTGQDVSDPFRLHFNIAFVDSDGDVGQGVVVIFINGTPQKNEEPMAALLNRAGLPNTVESGSVAVEARLTGTLDAGDTFKVSFRLRDAMGHESNEPSFTFVVQRP